MPCLAVVRISDKLAELEQQAGGERATRFERAAIASEQRRRREFRDCVHCPLHLMNLFESSD